MLSRKTKENFYRFAGPLMMLNGYLYRNFRAPKQGLVKVQLGPGQKNYLQGWVNVDANIFTGRSDVWADIRNPLPFHDESIDFIYSHHMIEHLPDLQQHFNDMYRCLKKGGRIRVGGPNGDSAMRKYVEGDHDWFSDFPLNRESIGGRLENFIFCKGEHLTILTFSFLEELAGHAGFKEIKSCVPVRETHFPELITGEVLSKEFESDFESPHTLIIEAVK